MKKIVTLFATSCLLSLSACDSGFEQLNIDPNSVNAEKFSPNFLFTNAQLKTAITINEGYGSLFFGSTFIQHMASLSNVGIFNYHGDKYVYHKGNNEALWKSTYGVNAPTGIESMPGKLIADILQLAKDKPEHHNLYHMTRIWRTILYHRLTDMYGDIPYFDAGLAYYTKNFTPKYDTQKDIYYHMLEELDDAVSQLDASKTLVGNADIAYDGDLTKWKKLGYSMMLRLGMRLSKVEPETAARWVKKAYEGGVFTSIEDNLKIRGTDATGTLQELNNSESRIISMSSREAGKISKTYFDFLKNHGDPRLKHTVAVYTDPFDVTTKNTDPAVQKGLPNGLDRNSLPNDPSYDPSLPGQEHQYSGVNRDVFAKLDGYRMFITYGETQLLLAEAAVRGWITADAATLYNNGVKGAMQLLSQYDASAMITEQEITDYLTRNPFIGTSNLEAALKQINTQIWATTFMNGYEAFANYRRSGYPELIPVNYPDNETGGTIPGRLRYPEDEAVLNEKHYLEAVARQGPDTYKTRVWWDKP